MLAQVTYIQKFIMADSEDKFMPICVAAIAAFFGNVSEDLPAGRRVGVCRRRAGFGSTHDARPMPRVL